MLGSIFKMIHMDIKWFLLPCFMVYRTLIQTRLKSRSNTKLRDFNISKYHNPSSIHLLSPRSKKTWNPIATHGTNIGPNHVFLYTCNEHNNFLCCLNQIYFRPSLSHFVTWVTNKLVLLILYVTIKFLWAEVPSCYFDDHA